MHIEKGLIIREPWISHILAGRKVWEMRSKPTSFRGWVGLIRQGSGEVVGVARIIDSISPLTRSDYMNYQHRHAIPPDMLDEVMANSWIHPWVLTDVGMLPAPVPYPHQSGPVAFVNFDDETKRAIDRPTAVPMTPSRTTGDTTRSNVSAKADSAVSPDGDASSTVFEFCPQKARALGRPTDEGFLVLAGSTAMLEGSPLKKRDREERDRLVRIGVLEPHSDPELLIFSRDHLCTSASQAAGIVKDGNSSGPQQWLHQSTGVSLKDWLASASTAVDVADIGVFIPAMADGKRHHVISRGQKPRLYRLSELGDRGEGRTPWVAAFEEILLGLYWSVGTAVPYVFRTPDGSIRSLDAGCIKMMLNRSPADLEVETDAQGYIKSVMPSDALENRYRHRQDELMRRVQDATAQD